MLRRVISKSGMRSTEIRWSPSTIRSCDTGTCRLCISSLFIGVLRVGGSSGSGRVSWWRFLVNAHVVHATVEIVDIARRGTRRLTRSWIILLRRSLL